MISMMRHRLIAARVTRGITTRRTNDVRLWLSTTYRSLTSSTTNSSSLSSKKVSWWTDPVLWGQLTAASGWTMSLAAIYDSLNQGPEVISLPMTCVLVTYSSMFVRWAWVVKPQNLFLASCHFTNVCAQLNQLRRGAEYAIESGQADKVTELAQNASIVAGVGAVTVVSGPYLQKVLLKQSNGSAIKRIAESEAGPFYIHFWAPMSKWLISGASMMELDRPTDKISLPQYSALTLCGVIHGRYALTVLPVNYMLCSVNIALFASSVWHLGRKIKADYL
jgi:hypothetical protein